MFVYCTVVVDEEIDHERLLTLLDVLRRDSIFVQFLISDDGIETFVIYFVYFTFIFLFEKMNSNDRIADGDACARYSLGVDAACVSERIYQCIASSRQVASETALFVSRHSASISF